MNAATIASAMVAVIEAVDPTDKAGEDDRFRVVVGLDTYQQSSRSGILIPNAGFRTEGRVNLCNTWQTSMQLVMFYGALPAEAGALTAMQLAVADAEAILAALYDWAAVTDGIEKLEADEATPNDNGQGEIEIARTIRVQYARG
jgi:hypothetical protein